MVNPICFLCHQPIARGSEGLRLCHHAKCEKLAADLPEFRTRITWRRKVVLQRKQGLRYVDCKAGDLHCGTIVVYVPWPWAPPFRLPPRPEPGYQPERVDGTVEPPPRNP